MMTDLPESRMATLMEQNDESSGGGFFDDDNVDNGGTKYCGLATPPAEPSVIVIP
jgi:hypothetical protein